MLYPTAGLAVGRVKEPEWAVAVTRAYNSWLHDKFLQATPRLKGVAMLPLQSIPDAVIELRRAVTELGMVAALLPGAGLKHLLGDHYYDPIYEAAQELNVPLAVHGGRAEGMGLDDFDQAIKARTLSHPFAQSIQLTDMMFSGLFDRFPRLRISFMEAGVGWALFLMDRMERGVTKEWAIEAPEMKLSPEEHLTSGRIFFHCELDEQILPYAVGVLGDKALLYATDFAHQPPQQCFEEKREFMERSDLSEETKLQIMGENARRLYALEGASG